MASLWKNNIYSAKQKRDTARDTAPHSSTQRKISPEPWELVIAQRYPVAVGGRCALPLRSTENEFAITILLHAPSFLKEEIRRDLYAHSILDGISTPVPGPDGELGRQPDLQNDEVKISRYANNRGLVYRSAGRICRKHRVYRKHLARPLPQCIVAPLDRRRVESVHWRRSAAASGEFVLEMTVLIMPSRSRKRARVSFAALSLAAAVLLTSCRGEIKGLEKGETAPGFALPRLNDEVVRFPEDFQGKVVAIRFWADWCPHCNPEMREMEAIFQKYRQRGLTILAVNVHQDRSTAQRFVNDTKVSFDVLLDLQGETAAAYRVIGIPTTYFVDRSGRIVARVSGKSSSESFETTVLDLL